jgi:UDP-glucuronate decarboxylase
MLGLAKRVGARFLLTSTSEVYGDPLEHPQKESYWGHVNPIGVLTLSGGDSIFFSRI